MAAARLWTGKVLGDLIKVNVSVNDFKKKLHRALQPYMQAPHAGGFDDDAVVQIPEGSIFQPSHQKSSADGMRL